VPSQQGLQPQPPQAETQAQPQRPPAKHKQGHQNQGGRPGGHQNQGRKKKKFFQKGSATAAQPGNSISGPPQGTRKMKQKGPREFVGPMDHSYRLVNGNIADGPPSTIPTASNGRNGSYYQDSYEAQPMTAAREDSPARIYCFIEDLFFLAKIQETARKLGVKVEFVKGGDKDSVAALAELPETERPKLLVFDLNNLNAKPLTLIPKFKAKLKKATSIIGFLNHLQGELKAKAIEAGCDTVMPRSAFSQSLPNLLRRYGMEEEEEYAVQPA
jgi:CheY-like chemotaxis protein